MLSRRAAMDGNIPLVDLGLGYIDREESIGNIYKDSDDQVRFNPKIAVDVLIV